MTIPPKAPQEVNQLINSIEQSLDDVVNHGDDDELFIASYLQGHFAVIARQVEMEAAATIAMLDREIKASLALAFENNELETDDQQKVYALWARFSQSE